MPQAAAPAAHLETTVRNLLLLSILLGGHVEPTVIPTESEAVCQYVEAEMLKTLDLPVINPSAPRVIDAHCVETAPEDVAEVPSSETEL
jgi:hypothetical protein